MQNKIQVAVRFLLGALFVFGGVAFFLTTPPPLSGELATFFEGLKASKYFFLLLKGTEIVCGLMLISGFFVPLALVVLAPIVLNILLVHIFLDPSGIIMALLLCAAMIYLSFFSPSYSESIKKLFLAKG